jgi:hypothetical protein
MMDPTTALQSILCGHMIHDHAEALRDWLASGGFEPTVSISVDCHEAFGAWPKFPAQVTADRWGIWLRREPDTDFSAPVVSMAWDDVLKLQDSEY